MNRNLYRFRSALPILGIFLLASLVAATLHAADDLPAILAKLDSSAQKFKSAQADIDWDNVQTAPIEETDKQAGTVLFERRNGQLSMALHLVTFNGKPVEKMMVYSGDQFKLYEPRLKQLQIFKAGSNRAQADAVMTVGFGGSGKDLEKNWLVTYITTEQVDGKAAAKLQLIPRDEAAKNTFPKLFLWVDTADGIALKQQRFDAAGNYNVVSYHNVRVNAPVANDAFDLKTPAGTQVVSH